MKKHLLLLFAALLPLVASAQTKVEIDGIWYNLVSKAKTAEVTFKGNTSFSYSNEYSGAIILPATVTHNGVAYSVTSIGDYAFDGCSRLTAINIPESVTSIGDYAFDGCSRLTAITIPEGVTSIGEGAFSGCSLLTSITIPEGVTSIGNGTFAGCSSLTAITIPASVTSIGDYAFYNRSLTAIVVAEGNKVYDSRGGCNAIIESASNTLIAGCSTTIIPESVTSIGEGAFRGCSSLTAITIPENVTSIGEDAFRGCSSLKSITIPEGVTSIEPAAFYGCSSLTTITIPEGVTSIGVAAFQDCSSLTSITIPESVTSIGYDAFVNCPELTDVYCYAESVPRYMSDNTFDGSYIEYATLHVPASAINNYKTISPWSSFGNIVTIEEVTLEKCATPIIGYENGKVVFTCDTEGATIKSNFEENIAGDYRKVEVACTPAYTITAYATKEGYEDSDEATLTICWVPCDENHEESDGIVTIPSHPVLISTQGGTITVSGLAAGTEVAAYSTAGTELATATATNGTATLTTNLTAGSIAIVKIGDYSIKVAIK